MFVCRYMSTSEKYVSQRKALWVIYTSTWRVRKIFTLTSTKASSSLMFLIRTLILDKVETPIHDSIRELVTWEWNHECVSKSERKCWALESEFLEAWAILHKFLKQGSCRHLFLSHRLIQNKQRNNCEATKSMARLSPLKRVMFNYHTLVPNAPSPLDISK
jgi:hypothetical protein